MKDIQKSKKVLVVDDDMANRVVLSVFLKRVGLDVVEAENGLECLERLKQDFYDLVLMDLKMPKMNGIHATQQIRSQGGSVKEVPVIAVTAKNREIKECKDAGMNAFLTKPVDFDRLKEMIEKCFEFVDLKGEPPIDMNAFWCDSKV